MRDIFEGMRTEEMEARILAARLGRVDTKIARMRLIDREYYADIGAAVGYDRRTVARRMQDINRRLNR